MSLRRLVIFTVLLALCGCSGATVADGFELNEFSIVGPGQLGSGGNSVAVVNNGMYPHTLVITDSSGKTLGATPLVEPGGTVSLEVDLDPGEYSFTCRIVAEGPDGNIVDHYEAGMSALVEVTG